MAGDAQESACRAGIEEGGVSGRVAGGEMTGNVECLMLNVKCGPRRRAHSTFNIQHSTFLAVLLLLACTASRDRRERLEFWAMGHEGEVIAQMIPAFERVNPGVHVVVQQIPWSAAHEKLLTAYVGESTPDVAQMGNTWIPEFAAIR